MALIYHLTFKDAWESAQPAGEYEAPSLAEEGFIHCSGNEEQALAVARRLYPGRQDILVLEIDTGQLESPVKREPSRSGEIYPHIYGPLHATAVLRVRPMEIDAAGNFLLS